ncbi:MAG: hypothetical protein JSV84_05545 [Gemmatimonadota bacterium]|nr:MAG: hypothetical protein JSV84_05545 [Gemmatimonadota bacterium]
MSLRLAGAVLLVFSLIFRSVSFAGTSQIKGHMFGDYLYNVANHDKREENFNEFQFRRIYFTFENQLHDNMKVRLRLESETEKTNSSGLISPYVKDAYLEWSNLFRGHKVVFGLSSPPTWELSEAIWGYRSIEKTIMDFRKIRSSREMGLGLKGAFDLNSKYNHHFMIGNGKGYKGPDDDKYKLFMYSFWVVPVDGLTLQAYVDYQRKEMSPKVNDIVYKGFCAYETPQFSVGVEGFQQSLKNDVVDSKNVGISLFASAIPILGSKFKVFGRFDYWDPDTESDDDEENLIIGGWDFIPINDVHVMPNIVARTYAEEDKNSDITARITVSYKWSSGQF